MLFDPKIKYNGKLKRVQFFDPSKVTLKDFDTIKNSFKPGDSLLVNENDSITEAIAKLDESLHPNTKDDRQLRIDLDAMRKLYPHIHDDIDIGIVANKYKIPIVVEDNMKIIFNHPLNMIRDKVNNTTSCGIGMLMYKSTIEEEEEHWNTVLFDSSMLSNTVSRVLLVNNFIPTTIGDFDLSEFQHDYLVLEKYVSDTNYVTIYKTNIEQIEIYPSVGISIY